jgi:hypothetical protein
MDIKELTSDFAKAKARKKNFKIGIHNNISTWFSML